MQSNIQTSRQLTLPLGEDGSIYSPAAFHANRSALPESAMERQITATSGRKCLEQYERFPLARSWARMFAALLIGRGGLVFEQVCVDLEAEGYEVTPFILPACGVGAPHRRDRVWFVAHADSERLSSTAIYARTTPKVKISTKHPMLTLEAITANDFRSKSTKHGVVDGIPVGLDECSLKAYGNAIVPQVALQIFNTINQYEHLK